MMMFRLTLNIVDPLRLPWLSLLVRIHVDVLHTHYSIHTHIHKHAHTHTTRVINQLVKLLESEPHTNLVNDCIFFYRRGNVHYNNCRGPNYCATS